MKKGISSKERILEAAERLFYERGYEQTSVQDILDELSISKGGFYHHFESKLQLLEEICRREGERDVEVMREAAAQGTAVERLNALFDCCGLWRRDRMDFAGLIIRVAYHDGSYQLRECFRAVMMDAARPLLDGIIKAGMEESVFFTRFPDEIGELILRLFANITDEIAMALAFPEKESSSLAALLGRIEAYRSSVEMLLSAPFGSVTLYNLSRLPEVSAELAGQDKRFQVK